MFRTLIEVFRREDLLQQAYSTSIEMLKVDNEMFDAAYKSLRQSDSAEIGTDVHTKDVQINEFERDIRRKVLAHLSTTQSRDIVFGLILISIVIDIERIGDYTKNIVELAQNHPHRLEVGEFEADLSEIETSVGQRFTTIINAFENSDVEAARGLMDQHRQITQVCDSIVKSLIQEEHPELSRIDTVAIALYSRYLKRVSSHITNIASGIVNPFDGIGFKE
ncbi:MAG: hypothetical protein HQ591_07760 [candidate division Zixibacteria bacterium]|nr:hypothetical protein [Candidatus Tariuqbacter arcticus]